MTNLSLSHNTTKPTSSDPSFTSLILMLGSLISIALFSFACSYFPWILAANYAVIAGAIAYADQPLVIGLFAILGSVLGTTSLWFADKYIHHWVVKNITIRKNNHADDTHHGIKYRLYKRANRIRDKLAIVTRHDILFGLVVLGTQAAIPDLLVIRGVQGKMPLGLFVFATIVGKAIVYLPFVYGVEILSGLIGNW